MLNKAVLLAQRIIQPSIHLPKLQPQTKIRAMGTSFPLDKPSWSVATLLKKPDDALRQQKLKGYLSNAEVQHLYTLSGLKLPDPTKDAEDFERVLADVNKLRDFLSHIQVASASEDLDSVEPLVRICEPVVFTTEKRDGDLSYSSDPNSHIGEKY